MARQTNSARPDPAQRPAPSAQSLFRFMLADAEAAEALQKATAKYNALLWLQDGPNVKRIRQAATAEELLDLIPLTDGLARLAWLDRARGLGAEALSAIASRLRNVKNLRDEEARRLVADRLISALRWQGAAGAQALLDGFDDLDSFGRSLAAVALGLLAAPAAADRLWAFYQEAVRTPAETDFVGALWGLTDLGDPRVGDALADLLATGRDFYELYGLLALAGNGRVILPLAARLTDLPEEDRADPLMALIAIGHRLGREALVVELAAGESPQDAVADETADLILARPADWPIQYFDLFFHGFNPQVAEEMLR
ncbi:MAG: hypothetical protein NT169_04930 [Chloroflexi bacterium]|nr:hypothetical protein [Chloroflexota bacterium]